MHGHFPQLSEAIKTALRVVNAEETAPQEHVIDTNDTNFRSLQYSLFTTTFVEVLGGVFFLITAVYILRDKSRAERAVAGMYSLGACDRMWCPPDSSQLDYHPTIFSIFSN